MSFLKWLYRRIGQLICFGFGAVGVSLSGNSFDNQATLSLAAVLLAVGLVLRHQMLATIRVEKWIAWQREALTTRDQQAFDAQIFGYKPPGFPPQ